MSKSGNLIYGLEDKPPLYATIALAIQHLFLMMTVLVFPVLVVREIGGSLILSEQMIRMSMIAGGTATLLQAIHNGCIGSGYLCPHLCGTAYLSASILAAKTGGIAALLGMNLFSASFEALLSRFVQRLRKIFPAEVSGFVVFMVGVERIPISIRNFFGAANLFQHESHLLVAFLALFAMVGINVWGKGNLRLYSVLFGIAIGYPLAQFFGLITPEQWRHVSEATFIAAPQLPDVGRSFHHTLIVPFLVASICSLIKGIGDITTCQKINDPNWKRPDMNSVGRGILAASIGTGLAGVIGGMGQSTSSGNIGLSVASGATSRRIAYTTGALFILLSFFPQPTALFAIMPQPVQGSLLVFGTTFILMSGIQIITSRMLDTRKIFIIGFSFIAGLSAELAPHVYSSIPAGFHPVFSSPLSVGAITAVLLNLIFQIGVSRNANLALSSTIPAGEPIAEFMETQGSLWGARKEVIQNVIAALREFDEAKTTLQLKDPEVQLKVRFDELNLDAFISYRGAPMEFPAHRPSRDEITSDSGSLKLAGFMIHVYCDRATVSQSEDAVQIQLHFDH